MLICRNSEGVRGKRKIGYLCSMVTNLTTGADPGEAIAPLKPAKVTLFTIILYIPENNIRDIRPFCRPLFCHSSVVK